MPSLCQRDPLSVHITSRHIGPLWPGITVAQMELSFLERKAWCGGAQPWSDHPGEVKASPTRFQTAAHKSFLATEEGKESSTEQKETHERERVWSTSTAPL